MSCGVISKPPGKKTPVWSWWNRFTQHAVPSLATNSVEDLGVSFSLRSPGLVHACRKVRPVLHPGTQETAETFLP